MSDATVEPQARPDPLAELRAADHRPFSVQVRARVHEELIPKLTRAPAVMLAVACAVVLVLVGWRLRVDSQPPIEDSIPLARPSPTSTAPLTASAGGGADVVVVHVAGAVAEPGLIVGISGWRVADAIAAAGGTSAGADPDRLNLAALIHDGERVYVPTEGEATPPLVGRQGAVGGLVDDAPVDLNNADAAALETLPGVGPATATAIIEHRELHGPFGTVDALVAVRGIGSATLEGLREHVAVG